MLTPFIDRVRHISYQIPRWSRYFLGKSELHPILNETKNPSTLDKVQDYICDLSPKSYWTGQPDTRGVPRNLLNDGEPVYFSIGIIQKLLGNLELKQSITGSENLIEWICNSIDHNDCIPTWAHARDRTTSIYSAMAQGQALSALIRVHNCSPSAMTSSSIDRLCNGFINGNKHGLILNSQMGPKLIETPDIKKSVILNGWIYALWGLREAAVKTKRSDILNLADDTTNCLVDSLIDFYDDRWSYYDDKGRIASPFYHRLHITQLSALYKMTGIPQFKNVSRLLTQQENSKILKAKAVFKKGTQKLKEEPYREFTG